MGMIVDGVAKVEEGQNRPVTPTARTTGLIGALRQQESADKFIDAVASAYDDAVRQKGVEQAQEQLKERLEGAAQRGIINESTQKALLGALDGSADGATFAKRMREQQELIEEGLQKTRGKATQAASNSDLKDNPLLVIFMAMFAKMFGIDVKQLGIELPETKKPDQAAVQVAQADKPAAPASASPAPASPAQPETPAQPAATAAGAFTASVPPTGLMDFSLTSPNLLSGNIFGAAANPPSFSLLDPKTDPMIANTTQIEADAYLGRSTTGPVGMKAGGN